MLFLWCHANGSSVADRQQKERRIKVVSRYSTDTVLYDADTRTSTNRFRVSQNIKIDNDDCRTSDLVVQFLLLPSLQLSIVHQDDADHHYKFKKGIHSGIISSPFIAVAHESMAFYAGINRETNQATSAAW